MRIEREPGVAAEPGTEGELLVRGPECFWGYLVTPEGENVVDQDGWFATGDLATLDADGYLTIRGRKKDIILRGGENISVKEVEDVLFTHPAVREAAIVAMPDPVMVERSCAFVVTESEHKLSLDEVRRFILGKGLAIQKVPERLEQIDELPRNSAGKVQKSQLRALIRQLLSDTASSS
jgi:cyclohexanecarboxylate-CoA ligase